MSKKAKGFIAIAIAAADVLAFLVGIFAAGAVKQRPGEEKARTAVREKVVDSAGNEFEAPIEAKKIVSLNNNAYDALMILGKKNEITGVSSDTSSPDSNNLVEKYGTEKNVEIDKLLDSRPDLVVAGGEFKKSSNYTKLKNARIKVAIVDLDKRPKSGQELEILGKLLGAKERAESFNKDAKIVSSLIEEKIKKSGNKTAYWELSEDYRSIGKDCFENDLLRSVKLTNIVNEGLGKNIEVKSDFVKGSDPGMIVRVSNYDKKQFTFTEKDVEKIKGVIEALSKRDGWDEISAVKDKRILVLSERLVGTPLGSVMAPLYIAKSAYPEEMKDVDPGEFLKEFMHKYWGTDTVGTLAFIAGNTGRSAAAPTEGTLSAASVLANASQSLPDSAAIKRNDSGAIDLSADSSKGKEKLKDSNGQDIIVDKNAEEGKTLIKKCIVLNSSCYEVIKMLGKEECVVGVTDTTISDLPKYGDWRNPNVEKIVEARPDIVFGYASWLNNGVGKKLQDAGIQLLYFDLYVPSKIPEEVLTIGKILGSEKRAVEFNNDIARIQNLITERTRYVPPVTAYWEGYTEYKSVGKGSVGTEIMTLGHVLSLTANESVAYPKISDEWILEKNPEIIIKTISDTKKIMGEGITSTEKAKGEYNAIVSRKGWSNVSAVKNKKVILLNSDIGTSPIGSAMAPLYTAKIAYPDKFKDIDPDTELSNLFLKYKGRKSEGIWRYYE